MRDEEFDQFFDKVVSRQSSVFKLALAAWIGSALLGFALTGVVIWGIVKIVSGL